MGSKEKDSKPLARIKDFFRKGPIGMYAVKQKMHEKTTLLKHFIGYILN